MKTVVLKLFVFLILPISLTHCTSKEKEVFYDRKYKDEVKQARKEVVYYMVRNSVPGATFAVSKEGKLPLRTTALKNGIYVLSLYMAARTKSCISSVLSACIETVSPTFALISIATEWGRTTASFLDISFFDPRSGTKYLIFVICKIIIVPPI